MPINGRMSMRDIKKIIKLYHAGLSRRLIGTTLNKPKSTVSDYITRFEKSDLGRDDLESKTSAEIYRALFPDDSLRPKQRLTKVLPDFKKMHQELKKKYITRQLLWVEYKEAHPNNHYGYTHFCNLYKAWQKRVKISMRINHKAGEKMFLDYSGLKWEIIDKDTGEVQDVDIFVATLGASGYTYAEASMDQTLPSFINCTVNAFTFFGGAPELLVPDNLKSAVTKANKYDPQINDSYQDMAEHYSAAVLPARPYRAKDKAKVELSVKLVQRWILAKLRRQQFFSVPELNKAIFALLNDFNNRIIKIYGKSRHELYLEVDKPALKPLPTQRYVYRGFKPCKVNIDYHIEVEDCFYSVPYQLAGETVSAIYTSDSVEISFNNKRVALHVRQYRKGAYSTKEEHMASAHRLYGTWTPSRLINWGGSFGANTRTLISTILASRPHPEMGFRSCLAILNAAKHHSDNHAVELTSKKMLELECYKVSHFKDILKYKTWQEPQQSDALLPKKHQNLRGQAYYH
ncbi:IS21 family transposase [candidate division KSB1 bacterium]|nr:IS21 family transposase [candidate division KSB1 bacterium]